MQSDVFTLIFVVFLMATLSIRIWLVARQMRHVRAHRNAVPPQFAQTIPLQAHQKAADYTVAKSKLGLISILVNAMVLICFTLLGGLQLLSDGILALTGPGLAYQLSLLVAFVLITALIDIPLEYYRQFVLEQHFGFNQMTMETFITDMIRGAMLAFLLGLPLALAILTLMGKAGDLWWFYAWLVWCGFQLLVLVLYPTVIAPMFNKFTPLSDETLRSRIENLMQRVGFASKGLFVMDGSRRSAHGNAYFTGFGSGKRIVFFDTLLSRLSPPEIEAVLAHELGHFKLRHIAKRIAITFLMSLGLLALLGYLKTQAWFYTGLGVMPSLETSNDALALILFMLVLPVFAFAFSPLESLASRKHEFEADAFAAKYSNADDLISALVKLYEDNASTLTPDPLHSAVYDSHPPASVRIQRLLTRTSQP